MSEQLINSISISYEDNGIITTLTATSMDELVGKIEAFGCVNIALRYLTKSKDALTKDQTAHLFYTIAKSGNFAELYALSRIIPEFYITISKRMVERFIIEANKDNWKKMLAQLNTFLRSHDMHHERQQAFELIISADNYRFNKNAVLLCLSRYKFSDAQAVIAYFYEKQEIGALIEFFKYNRPLDDEEYYKDENNKRRAALNQLGEWLLEHDFECIHYAPKALSVIEDYDMIMQLANRLYLAEEYEEIAGAISELLYYHSDRYDPDQVKALKEMYRNFEDLAVEDGESNAILHMISYKEADTIRLYKALVKTHDHKNIFKARRYLSFIERLYARYH